MVKRENQFTQDRSRYNFVSRKVFDRWVDRVKRDHSRLEQRFREMQSLLFMLSRLDDGAEEE